MSEKKKPGLTDEQIGKAAAEYNAAVVAQMEKDMEGKPSHEFSQDFYRKMHELCPSIDPETGQVKKD